MKIKTLLVTGYTVNHEEYTIKETHLRVIISDGKYGKMLSVGDARNQFIIPVEEIAEYLK